jgi:hypothetical protein
MKKTNKTKCYCYIIIHLDGTIERKDSLTELMRDMKSYRMY